jgi:hypothetical protein
MEPLLLWWMEPLLLRSMETTPAEIVAAGSFFSEGRRIAETAIQFRPAAD